MIAVTAADNVQAALIRALLPLKSREALTLSQATISHSQLPLSSNNDRTESIQSRGAPVIAATETTPTSSFAFSRQTNSCIAPSDQPLADTIGAFLKIYTSLHTKRLFERSTIRYRPAHIAITKFPADLRIRRTVHSSDRLCSLGDRSNDAATNI